VFTLIGLTLGAASVAYACLHPSAIGFSFPNINGDLAVRPTFLRLAAFLAGRWLGYILLGSALGWLATYCGPLVFRLALAASALLALFMFLFLATSASPELGMAQWFEPSKLSLPVFFIGFLSSSLLTAPPLIALLLVLIQPGAKNGAIFMTQFFLGNAFFSLPLLLNMKWTQEKIFKLAVQTVFFFCSLAILLFSINNLIKS
jgi:uncharacterized membrane protein YhdT